MRRAIPVGALSLCAFVLGAILGADRNSAERDLAERFMAAWARGDHAAMYALVDDGTRRRTTVTAFARAYRRTAAQATITRLRAGEPEDRDDVVEVPVRVTTRVFGVLRLRARLPVTGAGDDARVAWRRELTFPGVGPGQRLERRTWLPPRASILARDGRALASGPQRRSSLGLVAEEVVGELGRAPREDRPRLRAAGIPTNARVGTSGLERALQDRLAGSPGGELRIGRRVLARRPARPGRAVRTTIDPEVEQAAIAALGERLGGIAVIRPRTGAILALAGVAFSAPQPPGSTFKIVTAGAALQEGVVEPSTTFPAETATTLEGVRLENANGESCGGTFVQSFAHSCNSVFAPLGARLGARRLVEYAERFGFNADPPLPGVVPSTIPAADELGDDLGVGSTAIGQGKVQATALHMASVAAAVGDGGRLRDPVLVAGETGRARAAVDARTARTLRRLMVEVVRSGTGTAAAIPGVQVAGKTGTAELETTVRRDPEGVTAPEARPEPEDTDAWFAAFAPARRPRVAVGVLLVRAGAGGETAAPVARQVLLAALGRAAPPPLAAPGTAPGTAPAP